MRARTGRLSAIASLAILCLLGLQLDPASALSATDHPILTSPRRIEALPTANDRFLAWSQSPRAHPGDFAVYVRRLTGGHATRVSGKRAAFTGGFDGNVLLYYQYSDRNHSDIHMYDVAAHHAVPVPDGVNTIRAERRPTMSGDYLLFSRHTFMRKKRTDRIVLHRISTGHEEILASIHGGLRRVGLEPGQVSGDFATWTLCFPSGCNVYLHTISTDTTVQLPDRGIEYGPSASSDGTVFFGRSGYRCGSHASLLRYSGGHATVLHRFARNHDFSSSYAMSSTDVF